MLRTEARLVYSPSDLISFLINPQISWLDRYNLERPGEIIPDAGTEEQQLIRDVGDEHEQRYLAALKVSGRVVEIDRESGSPWHRTLTAMREGTEVIYQGRLEWGEFAGWSDFLYRVPEPSDLGSWSYEVWDTKLARSMKPYYVIQLCCYAEMLESMQGHRPEDAGIILGSNERVPVRVSDYWFYYQAVKRDFLRAQATFDEKVVPHFSGMGEYGRWQLHVDAILDARDDVSVVANIRSTQIKKLQEAGIGTVAALSAAAGAEGIGADTFSRLNKQAKLQISSRGQERPAYEVLTADPERPRQGFGLLPPQSPYDVYFDIEGYPLIEGGLEYLLGASHHENGSGLFESWWAHDRAGERASFERFVNWIHQRWQVDRSMHVYHYASYEVTALKRLMCRYASCEEQIDELLKNGVFVDLYKVVRQGMIVGEPKYSLKNIEHLYRPHRDGGVATAGDSIVYYHRWLADRDGDDHLSSTTLKLIWDYNRADCESTWQFADWLRGAQAEACIPYCPKEAPKETGGTTTARGAFAQRLLANPPADPEARRVHELLAHTLEFHRRENKALWWFVFDRAEMTEQELIEDRECLGGLRRTESPAQTVKKSTVCEYTFPEQESKIRAGDLCYIDQTVSQKATVEKVDYELNLVWLKRGIKSGDLPSSANLIPNDYVDTGVIDESIEVTVLRYAENGQLPSALSDYLYKRAPRVEWQSGDLLVPETADLDSQLFRLALAMHESTLCIQGPPGSGKTCRGAHLIAQLIKSGKRVAISSNGHNAICLLLNETVKIAGANGFSITAIKVGGEEDAVCAPAVWVADSARLDCGGLPQLLGGTAWCLSRPELQGCFDYLFVDEASQMSLAKLIGMARCAKNIVLLGDQMQLPQPIRGAHPGESGQSVMDYYLAGHATIPENLGVFLPTTWRMRPEICSFISDAFYDGRLKAAEDTSSRSLVPTGGQKLLHKSAGLAYVPVVHSGNSCESDEEVAAVLAVVAELLGHTLKTPQGERQVSFEDILVLAPFNLQVRGLQKALGEVRIGTVDKFQGEQAPIVIVSMTSSTGDESARGLDFLFDRNRLNVALSRAQVLGIIVASPELERARGSNLEQMKAVNIYCRAIQHAEYTVRYVGEPVSV